MYRGFEGVSLPYQLARGASAESCWLQHCVVKDVLVCLLHYSHPTPTFGVCGICQSGWVAVWWSKVESTRASEQRCDLCSEGPAT